MIFVLFHSNDFKEKKPQSCIMRTLIVLNLFLIIAIALSIAVMFRFAAVIQESKIRPYAIACISEIFFSYQYAYSEISINCLLIGHHTLLQKPCANSVPDKSDHTCAMGRYPRVKSKYLPPQ